MTNVTSDLAVIGMAVMGRNLALNLAGKNFKVSVWNRTYKVAQDAARESRNLTAFETLQELMSSLKGPKKILLMVKAGQPVDDLIDNLVPFLQPGDILIDGGNAWFEDTRRREAALKAKGFVFYGLGVSGGEEGARNGPSLMPGGDAQCYNELYPILSVIAAQTEDGPCVTHLGTDGAGHFVKMVHNGIEYADMQLIAETYALLKEAVGMKPPQLALLFNKWQTGPLNSFLIEITGRIFERRDDEGSGWLIDAVLDKAGQKGTGQWTVQAALKLGIPVPSIAAAVDARNLSSMKEQRVNASKQTLFQKMIKGQSNEIGKTSHWCDLMHDGLYASKIISYAQGLALIRAASEQFHWNIDLTEVARIWKGGCIIRAELLDAIRDAFERQPRLANLMLNPQFAEYLLQSRKTLSQLIQLAMTNGIPTPAFNACLTYYDSYHSAQLPQNLTQAQRDAFGAHTYQRNDIDNPQFVHSKWL